MRQIYSPGEGVSGRKTLTVDALILALFVNVVEATKHFESGDMRASIINDAFRSMLHEILE